MSRLRVTASVILLSSALTGCVSTKTIAVNQSALGQFRGATIVYKVMYAAKLRLIDTKHGKLLATGFCSRKPEASASEAPTYAQLLADNGALLKTELSRAAEDCTAQFRGRALLENTVASR